MCFIPLNHIHASSILKRQLSRIADHATNVAELGVYMVEGTIIRHTIPT